jgi:hypothetical protein
MAARHVIADAMSKRREQITGEASPLDNDGARVVLAALERAGYSITKTDDGSGLSGGSPAPSSVPRRFQMYRHHDVTGISGTGVIAEGTEYRDGVASLRWYGDHPSEVWWPSVAEILAVHGHQGATELRWLDEPPIDYWPTEGAMT